MKFDTVIIGGGLAGLTTGIALAEKGVKCAMITTGQSSLYFSSGSLDLLNHLPNGEEVLDPSTAFQQLEQMVPEHPYSKLGKEKFISYVQEAKTLLLNAGILVQGSHKKNDYRLTPIGTLAPTWLTLDGLVRFENNTINWGKVLIVAPHDYLDLMHRFVVRKFTQLQIKADVSLFTLPALERIKDNPTEFRSENIARIFDESPEQIKLLAAIIKKKDNKNYDAILVPACFSDINILKQLRAEVGTQHIYLLPTMPPSVPGIEIERKLKKKFKDLGGTVFSGDIVKTGQIENNQLAKIYTKNHEEVPFMANHFVLASGSFFSKGLLATATEVIEPIFNLDIDAKSSREEWYSADLYGRHNYLQFGVKTNADFLVYSNGQIVNNLYATGAVLSGYQPIEEGCGAGVAMLTGLEVAKRILLSKN